jgi:biopolymer transport protein ExbD
MDRHHKRSKRNVALNLVSLMDIFTILVFFLLVNSSEVQTLPNAEDLELPESIAEQRPRETVVIMVTDRDLLVQGRAVAQIADIISSDELIIPELKAELQRQSERLLRQSTQDDPMEREVTIIGDKEIAYSLVRRVMATATDADYGRLSLAVAQTTSDLRLAAFNSTGR